MISSRESNELIHRRLTLNLQAYKSRQKAREGLVQYDSQVSIVAYAKQSHLPLEVEPLVVLPKEVNLMHSLEHVDQAESKDSDVMLVYDQLVILGAKVLRTLNGKRDELIVKQIKKSYLTDPISKIVLADPEAKSELYQIKEGLIYLLKRDVERHYSC